MWYFEATALTRRIDIWMMARIIKGELPFQQTSRHGTRTMLAFRRIIVLELAVRNEGSRANTSWLSTAAADACAGPPGNLVLACSWASGAFWLPNLAPGRFRMAHG
jgi:hypothetical protein